MTVGAAYRRCERVARTAAANFYPAFLVLPRAQRRAMYALYAFNRHTDDLADGDETTAVKAHALDEWQTLLDDVLNGRREHPTLSALRDAVRRFGIPPASLHAVIEGCRLDLEPRRLARFADLYRYCTLVASAVGVACIHIWGFRGSAALDKAEAAGVALQLTNILRDLGEDRQRGRVYLPLEDLDRFGCDHDTICADAKCASYQALMRFETDRVRQYYAAAAGLTAHLDGAGRAVFSVILGTYRRLLDRIELAGFDVFAQRVRVPKREKLRLLLGAMPLRWGWPGG